METADAARALSALGHKPRLDVFRLLVQAGVDGMPAGEIALAVGSRGNTLSSNLNVLKAAGLVASRRSGRSIIYTAALGQIGELLGFLADDCCGGRPELCGPAFEKAAKSCD